MYPRVSRRYIIEFGLREALAGRHITLDEFCRSANISSSTLTRALEKRYLTRDSIEKIVTAVKKLPNNEVLNWQISEQITERTPTTEKSYTRNRKTQPFVIAGLAISSGLREATTTKKDKKKEQDESTETDYAGPRTKK